MPLTALLKQEQRHLNKMKRLEDQALLFTARALSEFVKERFGKTKAFTQSSTLSFAELFTDSMTIAWLYGQKHILDAADLNIKLSNDDIQVQFSEAIDHLKSQIPMNGKAYKELEASLKLRAFTIAAVISEESMVRVKQHYIEALTNGISKPEVMQNIDELLSKAGISESNPYWLDLHYRNNMMTAYNVGRWTQVEHNEVIEYLMYSSVMDNGTTKLCRHLDQMVKPKNDTFWRKYYPPNHHKCRAIIMAISKIMYDSLSSDEKRRSMLITEDVLSKDAVFTKEHQFKGSPTNTLERIPADLMDKAKAYGIVKSINQQTFKQSKSIIQSAFTANKSRQAPPSLVKKALSKHGDMKEQLDVIADLSKTSEAYYGLHDMPNGDAMAAIYLITWLKENMASVTRTAAFKEQIISMKIMSKEEALTIVQYMVRL